MADREAMSVALDKLGPSRRHRKLLWARPPHPRRRRRPHRYDVQDGRRRVKVLRRDSRNASGIDGLSVEKVVELDVLGRQHICHGRNVFGAIDQEAQVLGERRHVLSRPRKPDQR